MPIGEQIRPREQIRNPETNTPAIDMTALHGRILLSHAKEKKYYDPKTEIEPENITRFDSFEERDYRIYESACWQEADNYWQDQIFKKEINANEENNRWKSEITRFMNQDNKPPETTAFLTRIFNTLEIQGEFTRNHASLLKSRYKSQRANGFQGVKRFVADVMETYQDENTVRNDIRQIEWFAHILGGPKSAALAKELILAELELKNRPQQLLDSLKIVTKTEDDGKQIIRANDLNNEEYKLLRFITGLPIKEKKSDIIEMIKHNEASIIIGATGSGKSTMPVEYICEIMDEEKQPGQEKPLLLISQPRIINTETIPFQVAKNMKTTVGKAGRIGYAHGEEKEQYSLDENDAIFMTSGTMVGHLQGLIESIDSTNPKDQKLLKRLRYIMVDEIHIRDEETEKLIATIRNLNIKLLGKGEKPIKIIAVSATVDQEQLQAELATTAVIKVEGKTYPIEDKFEAPNTNIEPKDLPKAAAEKIRTIVKTNPLGKGNIITFVAGQSEIIAINEEIEKLKVIDLEFARLMEEVESVELTRDNHELDKLKDNPKQLECKASDFASTGVTLPDMEFVNELGIENELTIDEITGIPYIHKQKKSRATIMQDRGRSGRNQPSECNYLFTEEDFNSKTERRDYPLPALAKSDLAPILLYMFSIGEDVDTFHTLTDLTKPEFQPRIAQGRETLIKLGAVEADGKTITEIGKRMEKISMDYHLARMIIEANNHNTAMPHTYALGAILEKGSIFSSKPEDREKVRNAKSESNYGNPDSDLFTYLKIWNEYVSRIDNEEQLKNWAKENGINLKTLNSARKSLHEILWENDDEYKNKLRGKAKEERTLAINGYLKEKYKELTPEIITQLKHNISAGFADRRMKYNPTTEAYESESEVVQRIIQNLNEEEKAKIIPVTLNSNSILSQNQPPPAEIFVIGSAQIRTNPRKQNRQELNFSTCQAA